MPVRSIIFLLLFVGSAVASLVNPMVGVLAYVGLYHIFPETTWWGMALAPLHLRYSFVIGIAVLVGSVVNSGRLRFGRHLLHPAEFGILLFLLLMIVSTVTGSPWGVKAEFAITKMAKVVLFALLLSHVAVTKQRLWQLSLMLVAMTLYLGHEATNAPPGSFTQNRLDGIGGPDFRESAGLAIHLCALLPFVAIVFRRPEWRYKLLAFLAAGYGINGILLCRARSAMVGAAVAGLAALWYVPRRTRIWVMSVLVVGVLGTVQLSDAEYWERMSTIFSSAEERDISAASRIDIWDAAWRMIVDNPMGIGAGQFQSRIGEYGGENVDRRDAHNTYVLCASEIGIPGLVVYVATILAGWLALGRAKRRVKREILDRPLLEWFIFASRLSLIVYLAAGFFVSRLYTEGIWWFILLPTCISRAVENESREQSQAMVCAEEFVPVEAPPTWGVQPA
jgi:O-antigen ligase